MSHGGRLAIGTAVNGLCSIGDVCRRSRILDAAVLGLTWGARRPTLRWLRAVGILRCARGILRGACLRVACNHGMGIRWLRSISWPLVWREVAVVAHGNGLDRLTRRHTSARCHEEGVILKAGNLDTLYLRRILLMIWLPEFILRGCSCCVSCAV